MKNKKNNLPMILIILDGWGINPKTKGNAIKLAKLKYYNSLFDQYPNTQIMAHGEYVGLPRGQVGNSEAGHLNIGAGRVVEQDVVKIDREIKEGKFQKNKAFLTTINHVKKNNSTFHLMGLISNGRSPHSSNSHILELLKIARENGVYNTKLHIFTDGRDSYMKQGVKLIEALNNKLIKDEEIVTVMGRFYGMDRKKKWDRTEKAYNALVQGKGKQCNDSLKCIAQSYKNGVTDEFIKPIIINDKNNKKRISNNDGIVFFNLRSDRARQLTKCFTQNNFKKLNPKAFILKKKLKNIKFVAMTSFGPYLDNIITAYNSEIVKNTLPKVLSKLSQVYIAESEKYAHMTYFFNGGVNKKVNGEDYFMVKSPQVKTYDKSPKMKSDTLTLKILKNLKQKKYEFTAVNFASPDMIGHTANIKAGIQTCRNIEKNIKKIITAYLKKNGTVIITADHGNIETLINYETNQPNTKHTTNPVPFILINNDLKNIRLKKNGKLANIAPTILDLLDIKKPECMENTLI